MAISKLIFNNATQMDVTGITATEADVASGKTFLLSDGTVGTGIASGGGSPTIDSLTVTPSESEQTFNSSSVDGYKPVTVGAISSTYVGSGITQRFSTDLTVNEATVTAPAGYYASNASKSIPSGLVTVPSTITEGDNLISISNMESSHITSGTIYYRRWNNISWNNTPEIGETYHITLYGTRAYRNKIYTFDEDIEWTGFPFAFTVYTDGVLTPGTNNNEQFTIYSDYIEHRASDDDTSFILSFTMSSSSEYADLTIGSNTLTLAKTVSVTPDVTTAGYITTGTPGDMSIALTAPVTIDPTPTASGATVTIPAGYYTSQTTKSVTSGSATGPSSLSGTSATVTTGTNTLTLTKTGVTTTPTVSAGYISATTASTATVALTASVTTKAAATITPGTTNQTIASGTYLTGTQTISGDANLVAGNIKKDTSIFGVTGTYEGSGGSSKNVQVLQSTTRVNASSLKKALGDMTISKTGTYDIYWSGGRSNTSTSYTWGTRLYVDDSGYGTENTSWSNNVQSNHLSNVSLTANQKLSVYARGRTGSYYTFVPMLVIIEN